MGKEIWNFDWFTSHKTTRKRIVITIVDGKIWRHLSNKCLAAALYFIPTHLNVHIRINNCEIEGDALFWPYTTLIGIIQIGAHFPM